MESIAIGLLGAGNVGGGVVRILQENRESIERRLGAHVHVKRVLVRDPTRERNVDVPSELLTTDAHAVLADPDVRVVVELIGGIEPARSHVIDAIRRGKHVVTANKALLGLHGKEIFGEAARCGVSVFFEASVAGGIPILRSLREGLASDEIQQLQLVLARLSGRSSVGREHADHCTAAAEQRRRLNRPDACAALDRQRRRADE